MTDKRSSLHQSPTGVDPRSWFAHLVQRGRSRSVRHHWLLVPFAVVVFYLLDSIETGPHAAYQGLVKSDAKVAQLELGDRTYRFPLPAKPGVYSGDWVVHEYRSLLFCSKSYRLFEPTEPRALWEHHLIRGKYAFIEADYAGARTHFSEMLAIPAFLTMYQTVEILNMQGLIARTQGRLEDSIKAHERAIQTLEKTEYRKDRRLMAFIALALALSVEEWGDYNKADRVYRRALDNLEPDSDVTFNRLGLFVSWSTVVEPLASMYRRLGRETEANQLLTRDSWCDQWPAPSCDAKTNTL